MVQGLEEGQRQKVSCQHTALSIAPPNTVPGPFHPPESFLVDSILRNSKLLVALVLR